MKRVMTVIGLATATLLVGLPGQADWDPGDGHKMFQGPQMPDEQGFNVMATNGVKLADDWRCSETGPVTEVHFWGSWKGGAVGTINGFGLSIYSNVPANRTVDFPAECPYATTTQPMQIIDGLPPGTTLDMDAILLDYANIIRISGGTLSGQIITFDASLDLVVTGTGSLAGYNRHLYVPVSLEVHTGPKDIGAPVQVFAMDLYSLQGQLFGDPDFCVFTVTAGTNYGLPSPGQSTLTDLDDGTFRVDSFFDITYQVQFQGCPGSPLEGFAGTTTGTSRFDQYDITGGVGNYTDCIVPMDGDAGAFSTPGDLLWGPFYITDFVTRHITPDPQLWESWYDPTVPEELFDDHDNYFQYNLTSLPEPFEQTEGQIYWLCVTANVDNGGDPSVLWGWKSTDDHWMDDAVIGEATCTAPDNTTGTVDLPADCPFNPVPADETMYIIDGLPPGTTIELLPELKDPDCSSIDGALCSMFLIPGICETPGGSLGGTGTCFEATLDLTVVGQGGLLGFNRHLAIPVFLEVHHAHRTPGDPTQTFQSDVYRLQGELFGDPDFCTFQIIGGTDYGLPSPGQTTLRDLGDGTFAVESFFDITYQIRFEGCPGSQLDGYMGTTTATIRMNQGGNTWTELFEPVEPPQTVTNPFAVHMDPGGSVIWGGGEDAYGDGWYYYPMDNWWNIWFYDHPLDYERSKHVMLEDLTVEPLAPGPGFIEIAVNWSTDAWSLTGNPPGPRRPPLPGEDEVQYIGRQTVWMMDVTAPAPIPPLEFLLHTYNPEWVSVDIRGFNFMLEGTIVHTCLSTGDPQSLDLSFVVNGAPIGACCYPDGSCAQATFADCASGGGTYNGDLSMCEGDLSPANGIDDACETGPFGACCFSDGSCQEHNQTNCEGMGGTYMGDGTICLGDADNNHINDACEPTGACCLVTGGCVVTFEYDCVSIQGGNYLGDGTVCLGDNNGNTIDDACEASGACCHPDGTCSIATQYDCENVITGTYVGDGSICMGDGDGSGVDDACEIPEGMKWRQLPDLNETGMDVRVWSNNIVADDFLCTATEPIREIRIWGSWLGDQYPGGDASDMNVSLTIHSDIPSTSTVDYPADCPYATTDDPMLIIDGLPPGTTIEMPAILIDYYNIIRTPGGSLGGEVIRFDATLDLTVSGTGVLTGFNRHLAVPVSLEVHTGPKTIGAELQSFPMQLIRLEGELFGDPDFCTFRVRGGSAFGLPSPGHTTLTRLPDGDFQVDSFFDITYQIEFQGCPGSILDGLAGVTTATSRFTQFDISGGPGNWADCVVPDNGEYSRPGPILWTHTYAAGEFTFELYAEGLIEGFYDPMFGAYVFPGDTKCWKYTFPLGPDDFEQQGTEMLPVVYWLAVNAPNVDPEVFGWKTSTQHWNDDATYRLAPNWLELRYPPGHVLFPRSVDMAFEIYAAGSCCQGRVGDANAEGEYPDEVTLGDIMLMVDAKFISGDCSKISCIPEADVNQDGGINPNCDDHVTLGDIMYLVDFLFITGPETATLPDCL